MLQVDFCVSCRAGSVYWLTIPHNCWPVRRQFWDLVLHIVILNVIRVAFLRFELSLDRPRKQDEDLPFMNVPTTDQTRHSWDIMRRNLWNRILARPLPIGSLRISKSLTDLILAIVFSDDKYPEMYPANPKFFTSEGHARRCTSHGR